MKWIIETLEIKLFLARGANNLKKYNFSHKWFRAPLGWQKMDSVTETIDAILIHLLQAYDAPM